MSRGQSPLALRMNLPWRLALRDLRGGVRGMRVVLACLALGVAAIASVGSLRESVDRGLATEGARLLGGDIAIENGSQTLPDALHAWLAARGARVSEVVLLRTLAVAPSGDRLLVELKAVDSAYPLIGTASLDPDIPLGRALDGGLVADPLIVQRLGLHPGDAVRLGQASFMLRASLVSEPDHAGGASIFGPRVLIAVSALPATGLIQPGSLLTHEWRVRLPAGADPIGTIAAIRKAFPDTGWRIRDAAQAAQGLGPAIEQTSLFLTLVGLSALLVGGIGVATGVRAWLEGRARTIATLRCLGAPARLVFAVFLIQVLLLCGAGILIGVLAGAGLPVAVIALFGHLLPLPATPGIYEIPLLLAAIYGLLTAAVFALWPLGRAAQIPGAALFRDAVLPEGGAAPGILAANISLGLLLAGLVVATSADRLFALWFCLGALLTLAVFRAGAWGVMAGARSARARRPAWLRLGVANLHRPSAATPLLLVSLGLGLTTLAAVALIEGNISGQFRGDLARRAPSFFFIDIQNDQLDRFRSLLAQQPGITDLHIQPSLRARVVSLKGVPVDQVHVTPASRWGLRGDRGLTWAATVPDGSHVTDGAWWPADYSGPPLVSIDRDLAHGWGLAVGDTLRANVLGPRHRFPRGQPAHHRLADAGHQLRARGRSRPAGARAADAHRNAAQPARRRCRPAAPRDRRAAQRNRHPDRRHPGLHRRFGGQAGRCVGGCGQRHARLRRAGVGRGGCRRPAAPDWRGGGVEDAGRHARPSSSSLAGGVRRHRRSGRLDRGRPRHAGKLGGDPFRHAGALVFPARHAGHHGAGVRGADAGVWLCGDRGGVTGAAGGAVAQSVTSRVVPLTERRQETALVRPSLMA